MWWPAPSPAPSLPPKRCRFRARCRVGKTNSGNDAGQNRQPEFVNPNSSTFVRDNYTIGHDGGAFACRDLVFVDSFGDYAFTCCGVGRARLASEGKMRIVVVVIAALMTLGLAAFGVVAAQRANGPTSPMALFARVVPVAQPAAPKATDAPAPAAVHKIAATPFAD